VVFTAVTELIRIHNLKHKLNSEKVVKDFSSKNIVLIYVYIPYLLL